MCLPGFGAVARAGCLVHRSDRQVERWSGRQCRRPVPVSLHPRTVSLRARPVLALRQRHGIHRSPSGTARGRMWFVRRGNGPPV